VLRISTTMGFNSHGLDVASTWRRENSLSAVSVLLQAAGLAGGPGSNKCPNFVSDVAPVEWSSNQHLQFSLVRAFYAFVQALGTSHAYGVQDTSALKRFMRRTAH
jgi:hypothetical protein